MFSAPLQAMSRAHQATDGPNAPARTGNLRQARNQPPGRRAQGKRGMAIEKLRGVGRARPMWLGIVSPKKNFEQVDARRAR
jgi:hypothetical protein